MSKICLGTVQFGLNYGINNNTGKVNPDEVVKIMDYAIEKGIHEFDTASAYGNSESVLGDYFKNKMSSGLGRESFSIYSKLPPLNLRSEKESVEKSLIQSLDRLGLEYLDGYYLHSPEDVYNERVLYQLESLKRQKLIRSIGISAYRFDHVNQAIELRCFDLAQMPFNILDNRLEDWNLSSRLLNSKMKIFARSPFLQGLLLMDEKDVEKKIVGASTYIKMIKSIAYDYNLSIKKLCLQYVAQNNKIHKVVMGVDTLEQLKENIDNTESDEQYSEAVEILHKEIVHVPEEIIFPYMWGK